MGFSSKTYPPHLHLNAANATGETVAVERTSACPADDTGEPYVAIYENTDRRYRIPVAV